MAVILVLLFLSLHSESLYFMNNHADRYLNVGFPTDLRKLENGELVLKNRIGKWSFQIQSSLSDSCIVIYNSTFTVINFNNPEKVREFGKGQYRNSYLFHENGQLIAAMSDRTYKPDKTSSEYWNIKTGEQIFPPFTDMSPISEKQGGIFANPMNNLRVSYESGALSDSRIADPYQFNVSNIPLVGDWHTLSLASDKLFMYSARTREDGKYIYKRFYTLNQSSKWEEWKYDGFNRMFNNWISGIESEYFQRGEEYKIPVGFAEREPYYKQHAVTTEWGRKIKIPYYTKTGTFFDYRTKENGRYFPGIIFAYNVETKQYIEINTGQGDSEVLLIQDNIIYWREFDEIYRADITPDGIGEASLLVKGFPVPDVHWMFISGD